MWPLAIIDVRSHRAIGDTVNTTTCADMWMRIPTATEAIPECVNAALASTTTPHNESAFHVSDTHNNNNLCNLKANLFLAMKKKPNTTSLFPVTAIILIACVGIFCGCAIICHNFRRQPELSIDVDHIRRTTRPNHPAAVARAANNNTAPNAEQAVIIQHPPLLRSESRSSSKYDSLLFDDPPPKYEDAIKDYPSEIIVDSQFNRPSLQVLKSS